MQAATAAAAQKKIVAVAPHCYEVHTSAAPLAAPCPICGGAGDHHLDAAVDALGMNARASVYSIRDKRVIGRPAHTWCLLETLYNGASASNKTAFAEITGGAPADVFARANNPISKLMPVVFALAPSTVHAEIHPVLVGLRAGERVPLGLVRMRSRALRASCML
jgi:hypothetical protein